MEFMTNIRKASSALHSASEHTGYIKRILDKKAKKRRICRIYIQSSSNV